MLGLAAVMAGSMVAGLASTASAASAGHLAFGHVFAGHITPLTSPNSNIKVNKKGVTGFHPSSLTAGLTKGTCSDTNYSFSVSNLTSTNQQLTLNGADEGPAIPPDEGLAFCATGKGSGTLGLVGSTKTLKITIT
jgi:hypothetical protein